MSNDNWLMHGIDRRDFRHSDHPADWLPAKYKRRARRIKGRRVCGKDKTQTCNYSIKTMIWSYSTAAYYTNACSRCGRYSKNWYKEQT